jgi:hypothetical protein
LDFKKKSILRKERQDKLKIADKSHHYNDHSSLLPTLKNIIQHINLRKRKFQFSHFNEKIQKLS